MILWSDGKQKRYRLFPLTFSGKRQKFSINWKNSREIQDFIIYLGRNDGRLMYGARRRTSVQQRP